MQTCTHTDTHTQAHTHTSYCGKLSYWKLCYSCKYQTKQQHALHMNLRPIWSMETSVGITVIIWTHLYYLCRAKKKYKKANSFIIQSFFFFFFDIKKIQTGIWTVRFNMQITKLHDPAPESVRPPILLTSEISQVKTFQPETVAAPSDGKNCFNPGCANAAPDIKVMKSCFQSPKSCLRTI